MDRTEESKHRERLEKLGNEKSRVEKQRAEKARAETEVQGCEIED